MFSTTSGAAQWSAVRAFEHEVGVLLASAKPAGWPPVVTGGSVAGRPSVVAATFAVTLLDASNVSKSWLDAAEGVLYASDAQVAACTEVVCRSGKNQWALLAAAIPAQGVSATRAVVELAGLGEDLVSPVQ